MSFPRAKITRFNENASLTPSPADYNINLHTKPGGAVIPKSERFLDNKSNGLSENGSTLSACSTPCFRTPPLPKKKKTIFSLSARKVKSTEKFEKTIVVTEEALKDKTVECNNKDLYIKDLMEQIEEMQEQLVNIQREKSELDQEILKCQEITTELKEEHRIILQNIYLEHDKEISELKHKLKITEQEVVKLQEEILILRNKKNDEISGLKEEISMKEATIKELEFYKVNTEEKIKKLTKTHEDELKKLISKHKSEINDMEYDLLRTVTDLQTSLDNQKVTFEKKIKSLQKQCEEEKGKIQKAEEDANARIKQVEENFKEANVLAEIQMQEKCKDIEVMWKLKLETQEKQSDAILKECQAISEYNIIQCELEKKEIALELTRTTEDYQKLQKEHEELEKECEYLKDKVENLKTEVAEGLNSELKIKLESDLQKALYHKRLYEISINKSHETIETLKKRLLDSDRDVEQLKRELEACEAQKLIYQDKCNKINEKTESVISMFEEIKMQYEEATCIASGYVSNLEKSLLEKVDEYRDQAQMDIQNLKLLLEAKETDLAEAMQQLAEQQSLNLKAQDLIETVQKALEETTTTQSRQELEIKDMTDLYLITKDNFENAALRVNKLETKNMQLSEKLSFLTEDNNKLKETIKNYVCQNDNLTKQLLQIKDKAESYSKYCDYYKVKAEESESEIEQLNTINKKYIEQSGKYDMLLQKFEALESRNIFLEKKILEQESLIGPFREQLEGYEIERNLLLSQKTEAEMEARDIALKFAQLLGHQNQKQKIKHLVDLKAKNLELVENNKQLELKANSQSKLIEKLRKEIALMQSPRKSKLNNDKENLQSPSRTLNNSRVESPCGPLKERN